MSDDLATFASALAEEMDGGHRQQQLETAKAYEALHLLRYTGAVILHFQHGIPQSMQLLRPVTWKLT